MNIDVPAFLMCPPFSYDTKIANNVWMQELDEKKRKVNKERAFKQWLDLYCFLSSESFVYLLPISEDWNLQDIVFVANLGVAIKNNIILSNFTVENRKEEVKYGQFLFDFLNYKIKHCPYKFEGEAELKHLHDNIYVGGYGIRSSYKAYLWMEREFNINIIKLNEVEKHLYHLDCTVFPITREDTLVCTELYTKNELAELSRYTNIIDVSVDDCFSGICNNIRVHNIICSASHIHQLDKKDRDYKFEKQKNRNLEDIVSNFGLELCFFNLSEFLKGGALLSCLVMHLNRKSYEIDI